MDRVRNNSRLHPRQPAVVSRKQFFATPVKNKRERLIITPWPLLTVKRFHAATGGPLLLYGNDAPLTVDIISRGCRLEREREREREREKEGERKE